AAVGGSPDNAAAVGGSPDNAAADGGARPVMLWIHGGGFTHGTGSEPLFNGGRLAERGDVVVVTINYRLGALGYLALGDHGGDAWGATPNAGQLDQLRALQWVHEAIARFGGDPSNVTIFGQSAGAGAVSALLAMPAARGLFHKAIMESGGGADPATTEEATATTRLLLEQLGIAEADAASLRTLPLDRILEAQAALTGRARFRPVVDGTVIPEPTTAQVARGDLANVPILIGTNRDEMKQFNAMRPRDPLSDDDLVAWTRNQLPAGQAPEAQRVIEVMRASRSSRGLPSTNLDMLDAIQTQAMRVANTHLAGLQHAHQPNTYAHFFEWESPARRGDLGSCHSLEMPFVWGTLDAPTQDRFAGTGPEAEQLSAQMMEAWLGFARSGNPSHEGIGEWPAYDAADRRTMVFGPHTRVEPAPFEEERALFDELTYGGA
ncbi:MAG: carboxylesterase family protein, partial [Chloroflexi bacterium]|nr:carboxylesterase family protein [Chloroflexota bacterium]